MEEESACLRPLQNNENIFKGHVGTEEYAGPVEKNGSEASADRTVVVAGVGASLSRNYLHHCRLFIF